MQLENYIIEYKNALSKEKCDELIAKFESDDRKNKGGIGEEGRVDTSVKDSTDLRITGLPDWEEYDSLLFNVVDIGLKKYRNAIIYNYGAYTHIADHLGLPIGRLRNDGFQIQKTEPNGRYIKHHDASTQIYAKTHTYEGKEYLLMERRQYTFILYLNDRVYQTNGRTNFYISNRVKSVEPEAGKLLFFPASEFFPHEGEPLVDGVKYLVTGWITSLDYFPLTQLL